MFWMDLQGRSSRIIRFFVQMNCSGISQTGPWVENQFQRLWWHYWVSGGRAESYLTLSNKHVSSSLGTGSTRPSLYQDSQAPISERNNQRFQPMVTFWVEEGTSSDRCPVPQLALRISQSWPKTLHWLLSQPISQHADTLTNFRGSQKKRDFPGSLVSMGLRICGQLSGVPHISDVIWFQFIIYELLLDEVM